MGAMMSGKEYATIVPQHPRTTKIVSAHERGFTSTDLGERAKARQRGVAQRMGRAGEAGGSRAADKEGSMDGTRVRPEDREQLTYTCAG